MDETRKAIQLALTEALYAATVCAKAAGIEDHAPSAEAHARTAKDLMSVAGSAQHMLQAYDRDHAGDK